MRRSALLLLTGCLDGGASSADVGSSIETSRVIAVIITPSEPAPGEAVHLEAVVAGPHDALQWSTCITPRRPIDNTAASPECASQAESAVLVGTRELDTRIPLDACRVFGSETPAGTTPNAPDATGGYYQPFRVQLGDAITVARVRIRCALASAPLEIAQAFAARYTPSTAPILSTPQADGIDPRTRAITLRVQVSAPETYVRFDASRGRLEDAVETQTVSWFASVGEVTPQRVEVRANVAEARWTLPEGVDSAELWVVGRDDRGASSTQQATFRFAD